jgi:hypothetical protein
VNKLQTKPGDWKHLAEEASTETDPEKLMKLVNELNGILNENEELSRQQRTRVL